jgi:hypothetical protein
MRKTTPFTDGKVKDSEPSGTGHPTCLANPLKIFLGKSEGKRLLGRPRHKWEDNYKRNIMETGVQQRSSMRDIITSPSQISTSPSSGGPCYNKRGTDDRKWAK